MMEDNIDSPVVSGMTAPDVIQKEIDGLSAAEKQNARESLREIQAIIQELSLIHI